MSGLKNKVVLVTGASSGIGAGTAVAFARLGCRISVVARNEERLKEIASQCQKEGAAETHVIALDLSKAEACERAVEETAKHYQSNINNVSDHNMQHIQ